MSLVDRFGRVHDDLRVSVTDRCSLRCVYCMPLDPVWYPREEILTYEEIRRLVGVAVGAGVKSVRVTGGEPLARRDLPRLIGMLSRVPGLRDLSLSTNGVRLAEAAQALAEAGLRRVNVSLDTLDPDRFEALTRRRVLHHVLDGLAAAGSAGLGPVKVNTVVLRGVNDGEVEAIVEHARRERWQVRFIEFMPLENGGAWNPGRLVPGDEIRRRIEARWPLEPDPSGDPHAPARLYRFRDGGGRVGFIDSVSRPFCSTCSRLRLTADGKLRVCLHDTLEIDLSGPLRRGASDATLADLMLQAVRKKGPGGALQILERCEASPPERTMHQIGG